MHRNRSREATFRKVARATNYIRSRARHHPPPQPQRGTSAQPRASVLAQPWVTKKRNTEPKGDRNRRCTDVLFLPCRPPQRERRDTPPCHLRRVISWMQEVPITMGDSQTFPLLRGQPQRCSVPQAAPSSCSSTPFVTLDWNVFKVFFVLLRRFVASW
jgi:hypothetical protein